jgi:mono/diheme cytochrome c family protein
MNRFYLLIIACYCGLLVSCTSAVSASTEESIESQRTLTGISLYEEYCVQCHRSFAKTTKPQRSFNRLRSSIKQFPAMANLDFLNDEQLKALTSALATIPL